MERCPLQYPVVRYLVSLNPTYLQANKPKSSANKFEGLLQQLISHKLKSPSSGDRHNIATLQGLRERSFARTAQEIRASPCSLVSILERG